ncbi:MAG TPA: hypothetical protein PLB81_02735 [Deltaproteobacteria bacterium]|nr:hypothetical protein [Deltaproteobacteria bacterium]
MRAHNHTINGLIVAMILSLATPAWGDPSKFDSGNRGTSALGQLEDIAGQTVDRSPGVSTIDTYKKTIILPQKSVAKPKPRVNPSASMEAMVTGMVVGSLLQAVFSDNSQQAAAEAAARAAAEAERQRLLEQQRLARLQSAGRLRSSWDQRDRDISDSLEDALSYPGQGQGTNFFSAPVSSAAPGGAAPVDLSASSGVPARLGAGAAAIPRPGMPSLPELETSAFQERLLKEGAGFAQDVAVDAAKGTLTELGLNLLPKNIAGKAEMMLDYRDRFKEWSDNLFEAIEPNRLVRAAAGDTAAYAAVMGDLNKVNRQAVTLAVPDNPFSNDEMEASYKLLGGKPVTFDEAKGIALDRLKGFYSDKLKDRLLSGLS